MRGMLTRRHRDESFCYACRPAWGAWQAKAPDDELLANLESLSAPFRHRMPRSCAQKLQSLGARGSSRVVIVSSGGKSIFEFDFHVQQCPGLSAAALWIQPNCTA